MPVNPPTIQMRADLHWCHVRDILHREDYRRDPALKARHDEDARRLEANAARAGFDGDAFWRRFWK